MISINVGLKPVFKDMNETPALRLGIVKATIEGAVAQLLQFLTGHSESARFPVIPSKAENLLKFNRQ